MTDPGDLTRWARAHAATVRAGAVVRPAPRPRRPDPGPLELAVMTEPRYEITGFSGFEYLTGELTWSRRTDGQVVLVAGGTDAAVRDATTGEVLTPIGSAGEDFQAVDRLSLPDGRTFVAGGTMSGEVSVWDGDTGARVWSADGRSEIRTVRLQAMPDGRVLVAVAGLGGYDVVAVHDLGSGERVVQLGHDDQVAGLDWHVAADGQARLATADWGGLARVWDLSGRTMQRLGHDMDVNDVRWGRARDGTTVLVTTCDDGMARIWDAETGAQRRELGEGADLAIGASWLTLASGRAVLAVGAADAVQLWDPETGRSLARIEHPSQVDSVALHEWPDGWLALATVSDGTARVYAMQVAGFLPRRRPAPSGPVHVSREPEFTLPLPTWTWSLECSPDGRAVAVGGLDGVARIVDLVQRRVVAELGEPTGSALLAARWGRLDGRTVVAVVDGRNQVSVFDPATGHTIRHLPVEGRAQDVAWAAEAGDPLLVVACGQTVEVWDPARAERVRRLSDEEDGGYTAVAVATTPDRVLVAAAGLQIRLWTLEGRQESSVERTPSIPYAVAWVDEGTWTPRLISGFSDGSSAVQAPRSGAWTPLDARDEQRTEGGIRAASSALAVDQRAGGHALLAAGLWGRVAVRDLASGRLLAEVPSPQLVQAVAWGRDPMDPQGGRLLVFGGGDDLHVHRVAVPEPETPQDAGPLTVVVDPEPAWEVTAHGGGVFRAAWSEPDGSGRRRLATLSNGTDGGVAVWDPQGGVEPLARRTRSSGVPLSIAWERSPAGRLALAGGGWLEVWRPGDGRVLTLPEASGTASSWGLTWVAGDRGESLVVVSREGDAQLEVWDADREVRVRGLGRQNYPFLVWSLDGVRHAGRLLLASGSGDGTVSIWDAGTGALVRTIPAAEEDRAVQVQASTLVVDGAGRCLVAVGMAAAVHVWDVDSGELLQTLSGGAGEVRGVAWAVSPAGQPLLASSGVDGVARLWDVDTGRELARVELSGRLLGVDLALDVTAGEGPGGWTALLATASSEGQARVHRVRVRGGRFAAPPEPVATEELEAGAVADAAVTGLLALGERGLWPALGLVADVVTLTGPRPDPGRLNDPELLPLGAQPAFERLRELAWPAAARAAFAALLLADVDHAPALVPPPGPGALAEALAAALRATRPSAPSSSVGAVAAAAQRLAESDVTLLRILGPAACASDPTLPLRLRRTAGFLPALDPAAMELLAAGTARLPSERPGADQRAATPVPMGAPVVTDIAQHGPPARVLLTQLALPPDVFAHEARTGRLLYRAITHPQQPTPHPLTLVLDTTPATYGPVEVVLRLLAHLVTATLWQHGVHPALVTLDNPHTATPLTRPSHLAHLWTTRTLAAPAGTLPAALATAAGLEQPTVVLTHHRSLDRRTGAFTLVTTHTPRASPPPEPTDPRHHHVPPVPDVSRVTGLVAALVTDPATAL